jgi:hypothetical protein
VQHRVSVYADRARSPLTSASQPGVDRAMLYGRALRQWQRFPERPTREGKDMFASIRKYNVRRGSAEGLAKRVRGDFVPMMRQNPGVQELLSA